MLLWRMRLKLARHIVRSEPHARVLVLNLELCTLHFQEPSKISTAVTLISCCFPDGCAASLVTSEPHGIVLDSFKCYAVFRIHANLMSLEHDRNYGFDMLLSGEVPAVDPRRIAF